MAVAPAHGRPRRFSAAPALLVALSACLLYAAFADGATALPEESWLQLALAVIGCVAAAAWLYARGLRATGSLLGWAGVLLLVGFAAWTAASIAWSVAPDRSWAELNRAVMYALVAGLGIVLGASLERAPQRVGVALALVTVPVALYALGGKTLPGVRIDGVLNLDHAGALNRLKAPLEYWNALALFCVCGLLPMLRVAADPGRRGAGRVAALLGVYLLVLIVGLTYSRGGFVALVAGVCVLVLFTTERVRTVVLLASAWAASLVPLGIALSSSFLTADGLPLAPRVDAARDVLLAFVVLAALLGVWGWVLLRLERTSFFPPARGRAWGRPVAALLGAVVLLGIGSAVASGRAASAFDSFTDRQGAARLTDPNRLSSLNSGNRWTWWKEAAGAWSDKPIAGWGAGSFGVTHLLYRRDQLSVRQPHSVPLQWLAEVGIVGLLLAGGALLALLVAALARVRSLPWAVASTDGSRGAAAALLAVAVAWVAHALYDWDWDIPAVTMPMLLCLGVLAARESSSAARPVAARGPALAAAVLLFVLVAVSAALPALAATRTESALEVAGRSEVADAALVDAASDALLAASLNPLSVEPLFAAATIAERRGLVEEARALLLRALRRQPSSVEGWVRLLRLDFARGDRAALRRSSTRALELDPMGIASVALAERAQRNSVLPYESATATGVPLPREVPVAEPDAVTTPEPGNRPDPVSTPEPVIVPDPTFVPGPPAVP